MKGGEQVEFDLSKLRGRIKEKLGTENEFIKVLGWNRCTGSLKLNGRSEFKQNEIFTACKILEIDGGEIDKYFFTETVRKTEQIGG